MAEMAAFQALLSFDMQCNIFLILDRPMYSYAECVRTVCAVTVT